MTIYKDFLVPIKDYVSITTTSERIFEWVLPFLAGALCSVSLLFCWVQSVDFQSFTGFLTTVLAILVGFTITSLTVLVSSSNENISRLKTAESERTVNKKKLNLFQVILIGYSYSLMAEILTLLLNILFNFADPSRSVLILVIGLDIALISHILLINIRNTTNFYLTFWDTNPRKT